MKKQTQKPVVVKGVLSSLMLGMSVASSLFIASHVYAAVPKVKADAPNVYIVKKGDTLWDISKHFLNNPWRWKEIWAVNPQVKNPHWIYPKDRLLLCKIHGLDRIGRDEGDGCVGIAKRMDNDGLNTYKLEPSIRTEALENAIPSIPLGDIRSLLVDGLVMSSSELAKAPYVLAINEQHVIAAAGDKIYVRGGSLALGETLGVYRQNEAFIDPETMKNLGIEARLVGRGKVIDVNKEISTLVLSDSFTSEVREGDRVMIEPDSTLPPVFYPTSDAEVPPGRLIRVMDSVGNASKNSAIVVNRGTVEGAKPGQVMAVYRRGLLLHDTLKGDAVRLPSERTGLVMIYKVFDHVSYAIVLESESVLKVGDEMRAAYGDE